MLELAKYGRMRKHRKAIESGGKWATGGNGPTLPEEPRPKASLLSKMLIDCHDTTPGELPYWERKDAVEMLASEA